MTLDVRIWSLLSKGSISEKLEENYQKPAMRGPFSVTLPVNPETGGITLFPVPRGSVRFRAIYCGVRAGPDGS